jgi:hypothetical protein
MKLKLKYKENKDEWSVSGDGSAKVNKNYHQALDVGTKLAKKKNTVLEIYDKSGNLKEVRTFGK